MTRLLLLTILAFFPPLSIGIRAQGSPGPRPRLGVSVEESEGGVSVVSVQDATPASKAGLRAGDRIVSLGSAGISSIDDLERALAGVVPGSSVTLRLVRNGRTLTTRVSFPGSGKGKGETPLVRKGVVRRKAGGSGASDPLTGAARNLERALALLREGSDAEALRRARGEIERALRRIRSVGRGREGSHPAPPVRTLPDIGRIQERVQELLESGADPEEIEAVMKEEFGPHVRVKVGSGTVEERISLPRKTERSVKTDAKKRVSTSSTSSKSTDARSKTSTSTSGGRASSEAKAGGDSMSRELRRFLESLKKKTEGKVEGEKAEKKEVKKTAKKDR